ncbi:MAG: glycosyltransferase [Ilumatobacteraceae bacterium]
MSPSVARYQLDADTYRVGRSALVFGGSPPRLFRLTDGGVRVFETVAAGRHVRPGPLVRRFLAAGAIHPDVDVAGDVHDLDLATTSVVIPARNPCPVALAALVAALGAVHEIVVVDDGSTQPITPFDGATVVRIGTSGGPASARNVGLERCTTEFVVFVDSDVSVDGTDAVATLLAHFVDESVVAVAPRVRSVPTPTILGSYEAANSPLDLGARPALVGPGRRVSYVPTTMLAARPTPCGRWTASTSRCASVRTSTSCGGSSTPVGCAATSRGRSCTTSRDGRGERGRASASTTARRRRRSHAVTRVCSRRFGSADCRPPRSLLLRSAHGARRCSLRSRLSAR